MRRDGIRYSLFLHGALIVFAIFGLPEIFKSHTEELPTVMTVELLPVTGQTNVKPASQKPEPPKEKPEEKAEKATAQKAQAESSQSQPAPKPEDVPLPEEKKEVEKPKEPEPKKEEPKKKDDLASILKSVADAAKKEEGKENKEKETKEAPTTQAEPDKNTSTSENYDNSLPLSLSETDAIRSQIQKNWNIPAGAKDAHTLKLVLRIELNIDGSVISAELAEQKSRYQSDSFFRAAVDSALRAVKMSSPLQNLPPDKYGTWKSMDMTFDPKDVLY